MKKYSLIEIAAHLDGELYGEDILVSGFSIDSKRISK